MTALEAAEFAAAKLPGAVIREAQSLKGDRHPYVARGEVCVAFLDGVTAADVDAVIASEFAGQ